VKPLDPVSLGVIVVVPAGSVRASSLRRPIATEVKK
jgi:hypothetical protein